MCETFQWRIFLENERIEREKIHQIVGEEGREKRNIEKQIVFDLLVDWMNDMRRLVLVDEATIVLKEDKGK